MSPRAPTPLLFTYMTAANLAAPVVLRQVTRGLARAGVDAARLGERAGRATLARPEGRLVWLHGASVGEGLSLLPLAGALRAEGAGVLLTTGTAAAAEILPGRLPEGALHQFAPLDAAWPLRRFLKHWRPDAVAFAESEIWPQTILRLQAEGVPLALVNARMSARSAARWAKRPATARALFSAFGLVAAQGEEMAARLAALRGGDAEGAAVFDGGDAKAAAAPPPVDEKVLAALRAALGGRPVWAAVSTHPGEEAAVLAAHRQVLAAQPDTLLILVPRHPERGEDVARLARGLTLARRSSGESMAAAVYLADSLGETGLWFRLAGPVFLGGSLVEVGGHNPWEPAQLGRGVLHGPHVANAAGAYAALGAVGAAEEVTAEGLGAAVLRGLAGGGPDGAAALSVAEGAGRAFAAGLARQVDFLMGGGGVKTDTA
ncbi:3-deoxy-D-manno-octulosonic acid transferase [Pseudoroseicyclus sp. CXY001]|uniref:3-deoxy-D-manno-octulosonic acid transferase n=1 Tax=Pseudoroseicyclus sp. CXY001 TaxID=3242492 RepID=UPI003570FB54